MAAVLGVVHCIDKSEPPPEETAVIPRGRRSKGCFTCRRRKVKCDERRPACQKCTSGFHHCLGYETQFIFVNKGSKAETVPIHQVKTGNKPSLPSSGRSPISRAANPAIPSTLRLQGFKEDFIVSHLIVNFSIDFASGFRPGQYIRPLCTVFSEACRNSAVYAAGLCLAEAFFGRVHQIDAFSRHSRFLYDSAIRLLSREMQTLRQGRSTSQSPHLSVWCPFLLALYELVAGSSRENWLGHTRGVAALVEALGPYAFQNPAANVMLETYQGSIIIGAIAQRKRSFLENTSWKTIPWVNQARGSRLIHMFADVPGLIEDADALTAARKSRSFEADEMQKALAAKVLERDEQLNELRWDWEQTNPKSCWDTPRAHYTSVPREDQHSPIFDTVLSFKTMIAAISIVYFDTVRLLLHSILDTADPELTKLQNSTSHFDHLRPTSNALVLPGEGTPEDYAIEICRCVDFMTFGSQDALGTFMLIYPLWVARTHLTARPDVKLWLDMTLNHLAGNKGFQFVEHILEDDEG